MQQLKSKSLLKNCNIAFGTSGARGLVEDFTPEVCAAFSLSFVDAIKENVDFKRVAIAIGIDNRPSSPEIAKYCAQALSNHGIDVEYYGVLPTPALAHYSMSKGMPCIVVTGSHIPFDRNGLKFYRPDGEITKSDEKAILESNVSFEISAPEHLKVNDTAVGQYINRYTSLYENDALLGMHIGIYEHSSAGRDIYSRIFTALGAKVTSIGRSDEFVPIDTEAVSDEDKQRALDWTTEFKFDAIFSTDGDGDRPLIADENGEWLRGDVLGLITSKLLGVDALAVPVSCNTAIEKSSWFGKVRRTKIGSPYVIEAFESLKSYYSSVAGFEANGGYLLGTDILLGEKVLTALPTRDAVLPAIVLFSASKGVGISKVVKGVPSRFTSSDRIKNFEKAKSLELLESGLTNTKLFLNSLSIDDETVSEDETDGLRLSLNSGDIIHIRPSGNAPELRCYAESDAQSKADALVQTVLRAIKNNAK